MGHNNLPPDEDWWERTLRQQETDAERARARFARRYGLLAGKDFETPALPAVPLDGVVTEWAGEDATFWDLEVRDPEYAPLAASAHEFTLAVVQRRELAEGYEVLAAAALRVAAHLAGGRAIGYDDGSLCGNIVKCRWALAECRSCEELLMRIVSRLRRPEYAGLLDRCRALCTAIDEHIERLRQRVWW